MEAEAQLGLGVEEPEGELLCTCVHVFKLHKRKGKGECTFEGCGCARFVASGATKPPLAKASMAPTTKSHVAVARVLKVHGPLTDATLVRAYQDSAQKRNITLVRGGAEFLPAQTEESIIERREELAEAGDVVEHDKSGDEIRWRVK
jgi:hypothetical protein